MFLFLNFKFKNHLDKRTFKNEVIKPNPFLLKYHLNLVILQPSINLNDIYLFPIKTSGLQYSRVPQNVPNNLTGSI